MFALRDVSFEGKARAREREERSDEREFKYVCHPCDRAEYLIVCGVSAR